VGEDKEEKRGRDKGAKKERELETMEIRTLLSGGMSQ